MGSEHDTVKTVFRSICSKCDAILSPADTAYWCSGVDAVTKRFANGGYIRPGAVANHPPLRTVINVQQAVVTEETDKKQGIKLFYHARRRRPDRACHGDDVAIDEKLSVVAAANVFK